MQGRHLLEWELLIVGLDAADIVWRCGIQSLHEQVQGGAKLGLRGRPVTPRPHLSMTKEQRAAMPGGICGHHAHWGGVDSWLPR